MIKSESAANGIMLLAVSVACQIKNRRNLVLKIHINGIRKLGVEGLEQ